MKERKERKKERKKKKRRKEGSINARAKFLLREFNFQNKHLRREQLLTSPFSREFQHLRRTFLDISPHIFRRFHRFIGNDRYHGYFSSRSESTASTLA